MIVIHLALTIFVSAYSESVVFNGYPTNGAFQLYNPLRRLAADQIAGHDFQFFHGLGIVYLHYPFFLLFGKNLFASEMARWMISPLVFIFLSVLFTYALSRRWSIALFAGGIFALIGETFFLSLYWPANSLLGLRSAFPVIIGAVLLLCEKKWGTTFYRYPWLNRLPIFEYVSSLLLVLAFFFGSEHGMASVLGFGTAYFFLYPYHRNWKNRVWNTMKLGGLYLLNLFLLYALVAGAHVLDPLKYAFIDVPSDQFWYFGVPPNPYLETIKNFFVSQYITRGFLVAGLLLIPTVLLAWRKKRFDAFVMTFLLLYGLVANVSLFGYYFQAYTEPLVRIELLVLLWFLIRIVPSYLKQFLLRHQLALHTTEAHIAFLLPVAALFVAFVFLPFHLPRPLARLQSLLHTPRQETVLHDGVYLSPFWSYTQNVAMNAFSDEMIVPDPITDASWTNGIHTRSPGFTVRYTPEREEQLNTVDFVTFLHSGPRRIRHVLVTEDTQWIQVFVSKSIHPQKDGYPNIIFLGKTKENFLWTTYAGILESELGVFHPSYDYIIHALGSRRRKEYVERFKEVNPKYVTTLKREFFIYEDWLRNEQWDFYRAILAGYEAVSRTNHSIIWKQKETKQENGGAEENGDEEEQSIALTGKKDVTDATVVTLDLPDDRDYYEVIEVTVHYTIHNPWSAIPFVGKFPRFLLTPANTMSNMAISLIPYQQEMTFPALVHKDHRDVRFQVNTVSILPGVSVNVNSVEWKSMEDISDQTMRYFIGLP